jgi:uncharacterized protein DUF4333
VNRLVVCLVVAGLLAGCGGAGREGPAAAPARDPLVATADVERLLVSTQQRRSPRLRVGQARCPDQVRLANGTRFTCTVRIEDATAPYAVTLRDVDAAGTTGRFALQPAKPIIDVSKIVALIRGRLRPGARGSTVSCGRARVRVVDVGATIGCRVTLGGNVQRVRAKVTDLAGTVVVRS